MSVQDLCHGLGGFTGAPTGSGQPGKSGMELVVFDLHRFRDIEVHAHCPFDRHKCAPHAG
jgi:hypothetical protein